MSFVPALRTRHVATLLWVLTFTLLTGLLTPARLSAAFGLTTVTDSYTVDTGGGLVFKVRRIDSGSNHQSPGDLMSLVYNGVEYQDQVSGSQINSGFDYLYNGVSAVTVSAAVVNTNYIKITVQAGSLTHYYMAKSGDPYIYMATYFTAEPDTLNLCRYIVRIPSNLLTNGPVPSDIRNNTGAIESSDIFGLANGQTRSKHYSNERVIDWAYTGATGTNVGVWMVRDNNEGGSGGPFFRCLKNQCGDDQEITYIVNYGEAQTEAFRTSILNGPYILEFTTGGAPNATPDTSWVANMGLTGYVPLTGRGYVNGKANGIPAGFQGVVGFSNPQAQYWCIANGTNFYSTAMIPGTYTQTLYKGELAVATQSVTVTAGTTTTKSITSAEPTPAYLWQIGSWDGAPTGMRNADKVTTMHPSDVRMSSWGPTTYTVGSSTVGSFPCYQWKSVNNPTTIKFNLTAAQVAAHTLRIGITTAYAGGRPQVSVNSWNSSQPGASTQPDSRTLTIGSYRGNNALYSYNIPASAFVSGTNMMTITVISGSSGTTYLSPGYSYDSVELDN